MCNGRCEHVVNADRSLRDHHSRRAFFRALGTSAGAGAALFLAACGGDDGDGDASPENDIALLNGALDLEHASVAAYTELVELLRGDERRTGRTFLEHERAHADSLAAAITELGGKPNRARRSYSFPALENEGAALGFANDLEQTAVAVYLAAIPKFSSGALRATAVQIATAEAEHMSVLLGLLDRPQAPAAFVKGARKVSL